MRKFRLSPAYHTESIVFGSQGPALSALRIGQWVAYMKEQGIRRVCCLLHQDQLRAYRVDLLAAYGEEFGPDNVCWAPVADYHLCDVGLLKERVLPFLKESDHTGQPVVVHCQGRPRAGRANPGRVADLRPRLSGHRRHCRSQGNGPQSPRGGRLGQRRARGFVHPAGSLPVRPDCLARRAE